VNVKFNSLDHKLMDNQAMHALACSLFLSFLWNDLWGNSWLLCDGCVLFV